MPWRFMALTVTPMTEERIPRAVFIWVLIAQSFLLLPHMLHTPLLVLPVWLFCTVWRVMIFRGRWRYPGSIIKTLLVLISTAAIILLERRWFSIDAMILLLIVAFLLKLLELRHRRDLLISVYLAYFVIVAQLIMEQGIISALYMLVSLLLVSTALVAVHTNMAGLRLWYPLQVSARLLVFSIPVMVVAFLVFPRLDPLWTLPTPSNSGKTGMTDTLTPGMISNLAESDELAFRVEFDGAPPPVSELYWRGLVLSHFDGISWTVDRLRLPVPRAETQYRGLQNATAYRYRMIMEPSQRVWMFALDGVTAFDASAHFMNDYTLQHMGRINRREAWQMTSWPQAEKTRMPEQGAVYRALPPGSNPKTRELAQQLWQQSDSAEHYLNRILDYFRQQPFVYTLTPPLLEQHAADDFLFRTRRGFCEHYANAFVILARSAGLPARIVVGYQGGDVNPYEQHVTVRQLDAHAWAEVWLDGRGWVRFDPTYAVAPHRIEQGGQESLRSDPRFLAQSPLSPFKLGNMTWFKRLQYRMDQVNYLWHSMVLSYEGQRQRDLLKSLLGTVSLMRIMLLVGAVFALSALLVAGVFWLRYKKPPLSPVERHYRRFLRKLARSGLRKPAWQGAQDFAALAAQQNPASATAIEQISQQYMQLSYAVMTDEQYHALLGTFRHNIRRFSVHREGGRRQ